MIVNHYEIFRAMLWGKHNYAQRNPLEYEEFITNNDLDDGLLFSIQLNTLIVFNITPLEKTITLLYGKKYHYYVGNELDYKYDLVETKPSEIVERDPHLVDKLLEIYGIKKTKDSLDFTNVVSEYQASKVKIIEGTYVIFKDGSSCKM